MQMRSQEASFGVITAVVGGQDLSTCTLNTHAHAGMCVSSCTGGSKVENRCVWDLKLAKETGDTASPLPTRRPSQNKITSSLAANE